jgi:RNA polymerase sigma-70 factor (ECF subfamily)
MSTTASETARARPGTLRQRLFFERLTRRLYAGVYNYLCWIGRDPQLAEDLTQETFMQVWQHLDEIRDRRAARAWVYRVARREFLQHVRRPGLGAVALDDCPSSDLADPQAPDPHVSLERRDLQIAVGQAVEKLADIYREVIVLHNLEGFSLAQVAEVLQIPVGTVKSRRARAFSVLRHLLRREVMGNEM